MIGAYLTDTITLITATVDAYGEKTETTTTVDCFVKRESKVIKTEGGEDVLALGFVLFPDSVTITHETMLTVDGSRRRPVRIETKRDFSAVLKKVWYA